MNINKIHRKIVASSSTLYERMDAGDNGIISETPEDKIAYRLKKWLEITGEKEADFFRERFSDIAPNREWFRNILADEFLIPAQLETPWAGILLEVLSSVSDGTAVNTFGKINCLKEEEKIPFEEILSVFVSVAMDELEKNTRIHELLSEVAVNALIRMLFKRLSMATGRALQQEFAEELKRSKDKSSSSIEDIMDIPAGLLALWTGEQDISDEGYQRFVQRMLQGGLIELFEVYPVLARLMAEVSFYWVETSREFLQSLEVDLPEIRNLFPGLSDIDQVSKLDASLSDPHNYGRTVIMLEYGEGRKLIYKPRDVGIEREYFKLLAWMNEISGKDMFKVLAVLDKEKHGWIEFCDHLPCNNIEEVELFYRRSGMLLGVMHLLRASDFHFENIIASGAYPVAIDLEAMLLPLHESVLSTLYLPAYARCKGKEIFYLSGMDTEVESKRERIIEKWKFINTDSMCRIEMKEDYSGAGNRVLKDGAAMPATGYIKQILEGFRSAYDLFLQQQKELADPDGRLSELRGCMIRVVLRMTMGYYSILQNSLKPEYLRSGIERSIRLDRLSRTLPDQENILKWNIIRDEHVAISRMDIPIFFMYSDRKDLYTPAGISVADYQKEMPIDILLRHVAGFNEREREWQAEIISKTFDMQKHIKKYMDDVIEDSDQAALNRTQPLDAEAAGRRAEDLGDAIMKFIIASDSSLSWLTTLSEKTNEVTAFIALSDLYGGVPGILLFLTALKKVRGWDPVEYYPGGINKMLDVYYSKALGDDDLIRRSISLGSGLSGQVYSLVKSYEMLGDDKFLSYASGRAELITRDMIDRDSLYDILGGTAGALVAFLSLYRATGNRLWLDQASYCGDHLLKNRSISSNGYLAWKSTGIPTVKGDPMLGFAHGIAGIALSLLRLFRETGERRYLDAAIHGIEYENSMFSVEENNWPDFRVKEKGEKIGYMASWCHGGPGILLSRLEGKGIMEDDILDQDIERALRLINSSDAKVLDDCCCGYFSLINILLTAGEKLDRIELTQEAHARIAGHLTGGEEKVKGSLGFFKGKAGIGYTLLRTIDNSLPSVLSFD